jgi:hypothetical protein
MSLLRARSPFLTPFDQTDAFGEAVLVRVGGRVVLRGGSMADRMEALEWMAMFMPDAVASLRE